MVRKQFGSDENGMTLRSAKTSAKIHRSFIKNGETHNIEEFVVGTPEYVKNYTSACNNGEKVEIEHVHTTQVFDKEEHIPTNDGVVKRRTEIIKQGYDFGTGDSSPIWDMSPASKNSGGSTVTNNTTYPQQQPQTSSEGIDPLSKGERFLKNMIKTANSWIMIAVGVGIVALAIAIVALFI